MMSGEKNWNLKLTEFAKNSQNPMRILYEQHAPEGNPLKSKIDLQPGDPNIYGNFPPHPEIIKAIIASILKDNFTYYESNGHKVAREAVAKNCSHMGNVSSEDIIMTSGCNMAIEMCAKALADIGDNILIPKPCFPYSMLIKQAGIDVKYYDLDCNRDWEINLEHLEGLIDSRTRAILVNSPGNPCGNVFSMQHILEILKVAERHHLPIISDEVYGFFVFPEVQFYSFATLSTNVPILVVSSLSKRYLLPSARIGYIVVCDRGNKLENISKGLRYISGRNFGPNGSFQLALPEIFKNVPQSFLDEMCLIVYGHAKLLYERLNKIPGLKPTMPKGSMFMFFKVQLENFPQFKTTLEFMQKLANDENVFVFPSECFNFPGFIRIILTAPEKLLIDACDRIEHFCAKYYMPFDGLLHYIDINKK